MTIYRSQRKLSTFQSEQYCLAVNETLLSAFRGQYCPDVCYLKEINVSFSIWDILYTFYGHKFMYNKCQMSWRIRKDAAPPTFSGTSSTYTVSTVEWQKRTCATRKPGRLKSTRSGSASNPNQINSSQQQINNRKVTHI